MSKAAATLQIQAPALVPASSLVQRKCACGGNASALKGECESCRQKKLGLQTKLALGTPGDAYEQEADRVADEVMRMGEPSVQRRMGGPSIQRQSPTDEKKETPPPKPTEDAAAPPVAVAAAQPSCSPTGMTRVNFLKAPGTSAKDFGLTALDLSAVTYPELVTEKTKGGVRVKPTSAALPTIPSVYTGNDTFTEGEAHFLGQNNGDCASKKYPIRWTITPQGATKIGEGEQEHCADFNQAFDISLKRYAAAVNGLAGKTFGNDKKAEQAVVKTTGAAPADWYSIFSCLARKTLARDTTSHTPKPTTREPRLATNCAFVSAFITGTSLPQVGQTASADLIKDCGETGAASKAKTKSARQTSGEVGMPDLSSETWEAWAADADSEEAALLQRKSAPGVEGASAPPASVHHALAASGQPLDATTKSFMESRFGHDFGQVRLHTDSTADQSAREVDALAYTVGSHVVFRAGSFAPHTGEGRKLLAHELTHVVQQGHASRFLTPSAGEPARVAPAQRVERKLQRADDPAPFPGFSQGDFVTCGAASVVTALMIWDRERKDASAPNEIAVTACNLILTYMVHYRSVVIKSFKDRGKDGEAIYKVLFDGITAVRDTANAPGAALTESDYQSLGVALYALHASGSNGMSTSEINALLNKLGLGGGASDSAATLGDILATSVVTNLEPERIAQISWLARTSGPTPEGKVSVTPHAFLVGRFKDGKWFLSDQGMNPPTELAAGDLATLQSAIMTLARTGKSHLHTGPKPEILPAPWTGATLLGKHEDIEKKGTRVITPGDFLAEVDAGVTTSGDRIVAWDYLVRRDSLDEAKKARSQHAGAHGFVIIEMPAGVFHLYKTNLVSEDNLEVTGIDKDDSTDGKLGRGVFYGSWLALCSSKSCKADLIRVD